MIALEEKTGRFEAEASLNAGSFKRWFFRCLVLFGFIVAGTPTPLVADPTPSFDQISVKDEGAQISVDWRFYYRLLPPKFALREKNSRPIDLDDPGTLKQSLTNIASVAFEVTLDDASAPMTQMSEITIAPDGSCSVELQFPGRKNGHVEFRDRMLEYYPATYVINYQIYSPLDPAGVVSGYFTGGANPPTVKYTQLAADFQPSIFDWLHAPPVKLFEAELRTAWINPNLLFATILILLFRPAKEFYPLAYALTVPWFIPCFIWTMDGLQIPITIHPIVPALLTAGICYAFLCAVSFKASRFAYAASGLLNGCFDIQQTSLMRPAPEMINVVGMALGFATGLGLVFAVGYPIIQECRKHPEFQQSWAPKIGWLLAILALVLPWV